VIDAVCAGLLLLGAWQVIPWRAGRYLHYVSTFVGFAAYVAIGLRAAWLVAGAGAAGTAARILLAPRGAGVPPVARSLGAISVATVAGMLVAHGLVTAFGLSYPLPVSTPGTVASFTAVLWCLFGATTLVKEGIFRAARMERTPPAEEATPGLASAALDYGLGVAVAGPLHYVAQLFFLRGLVGAWIGAMGWSFLLNAVLRRELERNAQGNRALRELARKEHMAAVGELAARIVHQTRHQLGLIGISAHRIGKRIGALAGEDARVVREELDKLDEIQRELGDMLTRDLRAASDRSGKLPATYAALIAAVARRLEPVAETRGVRLEVGSLEALAGATPANSENVSHALFNVVENALTAARQIVRVEVASPRSGSLVISIVDDGPGLSAAALDRATEPFFTTKADGTGMGLAIARAAFDQEGAELRIVNGPEGGCQVQIAILDDASGG
jgi:signal transduction histidine kinase